jgi:hypothetical protein
MPLHVGLQFLMAQAPGRFEEQVAFMSELCHMRPSDAKKQPQVQVSHKYRCCTSAGEPQVQVSHKYRCCTSAGEPQVQVLYKCR